MSERGWLLDCLFQEYWDFVGDRFKDVCNHIFGFGIMAQDMAIGLIYMIPKGTSQSVEVGNWRPVTLLNTIYKFYAKAMSLRKQRMLPTLVHHSQTGFVK